MCDCGWIALAHCLCATLVLSGIDAEEAGEEEGGARARAGD